jgi:transposase
MQKSRIVFKPYQFNPQLLLPPSFDELIPQHHPVRVVQHVMSNLDIDNLLEEYSGGGSSSYHPRMMLSALVYAYLQNTYSSRKIEAALKENIFYMWLTGMSTPDHNTINNFRGKRLKKVIKEVFSKVVMLLADEGLLGLNEVYTDGTKIEANANKYTFVWGKSIQTQKEKIAKQLEELWDYAQSVTDEELKDTTPTSFAEITSEKVKAVAKQIDEALKGKNIDKEVEKKVKKANTDFVERMQKYEAQEGILGNRNSYSKTDTDATFMRLKEDAMNNGQLKAAYNLQASAVKNDEEGSRVFCVNYTLHQKPNDTTTLIPHLDEHEKLYGKLPDVVTADAGYGSEENYQYLEDKEVEAYVKYNQFYKEQKRVPSHKQGFAGNELYYNQELDCYYCPMGQAMVHTASTTRKTENGYTQHVKRYTAQNCTSCPLRGVCHKAKGNRSIEVNDKLNAHKAKAKEKLNSEFGIKHRKKRSVTAEPVFAVMKQNKNFKRFMLRGSEKVNIEAGLCLLAFNLKQKSIHNEEKMKKAA